ncbi:hypothetical protein ACSS6W_000524 [Trichoderma asperelloides]
MRRLPTSTTKSGTALDAGTLDAGLDRSHRRKSSVGLSSGTEMLTCWLSRF